MPSKRPGARLSMPGAIILAVWLGGSVAAQVAVAPAAEEPRPEFSVFIAALKQQALAAGVSQATADRKSTRLNSSHEWISRMPSSA